tara:strand:+ start:347 stop:643 length:297 start_codon:yes stop_codon:yes gene_type:complete
MKLKSLLYEIKSPYQKVEFVYTEQGGLFYGTDVHKNKSQKQRTAKLGLDDTNKYLKSMGIDMEVPRRYGSGRNTLDKIVRELKISGVKASHHDFMDVS